MDADLAGKRPGHGIGKISGKNPSWPEIEVAFVGSVLE